MSFESFHFHARVAGGIEAVGYTAPTSIQVQSIPSILQGRDLMGLAQTGTGKTAAFVLPILQRLMVGQRRRLRALILAPTRELAEQTHEAVGQMGRYTKLKSATVYGGVGKNLQVKALREGVEIAVACPGRLIDLLNQKTVDLSGVEIVVLDEADRMFDMGFLPDVRKILSRLPIERQTLLFSATMPEDVRYLAQEMLQDPVTVRVGETTPASTVAHALYPVKEHLKTDLLIKLLGHTDTASVLVFTRTKHRAKRLGLKMERAGFLAASIQGNLSQQKRRQALDGFRDGTYQVLVATDIAARGIDVSGISHVINYDMPDTVDSYTHRIGRTGRAARTGDAFTFVTSDDMSLVAKIERVLGERLERRRLEDFDYKAPNAGGAEFRPSRPQGDRRGRATIGRQRRS